MENVQIVRSLKRRSVTIQILPDASVRVSVPYFFPTPLINKFLREKAEWIKTHQQKIIIRNPKKEKEEYMYLGKIYRLENRHNKKALVEVEDKIYIASTNKKYIKNYLTSWYKQQARKII